MGQQQVTTWHENCRSAMNDQGHQPFDGARCGQDAAAGHLLAVGRSFTVIGSSSMYVSLIATKLHCVPPASLTCSLSTKELNSRAQTNWMEPAGAGSRAGLSSCVGSMSIDVSYRTQLGDTLHYAQKAASSNHCPTAGMLAHSCSSSLPPH